MPLPRTAPRGEWLARTRLQSGVTGAPRLPVAGREQGWAGLGLPGGPTAPFRVQVRSPRAHPNPHAAGYTVRTCFPEHPPTKGLRKEPTAPSESQAP